jgi:DNA repair protein RadC
MRTRQSETEKAIAAFAAILDSCRVPAIESDRVTGFLRTSGIAALLDFASEDTLRSALGISRTTSRLLQSVCVILHAASETCAIGESITPEQVANDLRLLDHEEMRGLYFSADGNLLHAQTLSIGEQSEVEIDVFACLRPAVILRTRRMELMHNHPSGDPSPSARDITSCQMLARTARELEINVSVLWIVTSDSTTRHTIQ